MSDERVQDVLGPDRKRRVVIYRRPSRSFYFEVERWSEEPEEQGWIPLPRVPIGLYETAAQAECAARGLLGWPAVEPAGGATGVG